MATALASCLAFAIAAIVYLPSLQAGLVSDDFFFTRRLWPLNPLALAAMGWEHQLGRAVGYRPVTLFSYALNQALQSPPWAYHAMNLVMHGAATAAIVAWARRLGLDLVAALVAGLCFALHPVHHEGVAWIAGRTVVLSTGLALAALALATGPEEVPRRRWLVAGVALLSVLAYEGVLLLPLIIWASVAVAVAARQQKAQVATRAVLPVGLLWVLYLVFRWTVLSSPADDLLASSSAVHDEGFAAPVAERVADNARAWSRRLLGAGIGVPAHMSMTFWVTTAAATAAAVVTWTAHRQHLALFLLVAVATFVPFVSLPGYADRFSYFSSAAVCMTLGLGVHAAGKSRRWLLVAVLVMVSATGLLWTRQLSLAQRDWVEAGRIAARVQTESLRVLPDPPREAHLHYVAVPLGLGGAYVYITYFDRAIQQAYGRNDIVVSVDPSPEGMCPPLEKSIVARCLRWDSTDETMSVVRSRPGREAHRPFFPAPGTGRDDFGQPAP